jgi:glutamyl-tRNA synthetase
MLRLDDTDAERSKTEYVDGLYDDLSWMGLDYDKFARQSDRRQRYQECQQRLIQSGRLYPCYETFEELEFKRRVQLAKKQPPIYDRAALCATEGEGRRPHWRFKLSDEEVAFDDMIKGHISVNPVYSLSDPVLIKEDGTFLYTISSVIDDIDFEITHIIRGEDHVTNTVIQIQLFNALKECLGITTPGVTFAHLALLLDASGQPLSKRLSSFCLKNLRSDGIEAMALNCFLASLGSSLHITNEMQELIDNFDLGKVRGGARVDEKALIGIQHKILHTMPFRPAFGVNENEWNVIRESLDRIEDVEYWRTVLHGRIVPPQLSDEDAVFIHTAAEWLHGVQCVSDETWLLWTRHLTERTGRTGYNLVHPLRLALTGRERGPEMKRLLPLMDRGIILGRLYPIYH